MPSKSSSARPAAAPKRSRAAASAAAEAPIPVPAPADPTAKARRRPAAKAKPAPAEAPPKPPRRKTAQARAAVPEPVAQAVAEPAAAPAPAKRGRTRKPAAPPPSPLPGTPPAAQVECLAPDDGALFGRWSVRWPGEPAEQVLLRAPDPGSAWCSCLDFALSEDARCAHVDSVLDRVRDQPAWAAGPRRAPSRVVLQQGSRRRPLWLAGTECPAGLHEHASTLFAAEPPDASALPRLLRAARDAGHRVQVDEAVWRHLAALRDLHGRVQRLEQLLPDGPASAELQALTTPALLPVQAEGALFALCAGRCVLADCPELEAPQQALAALRLARRRLDVERVLVLAPADALEAWRRALGDEAGVSLMALDKVATDTALHRSLQPDLVVVQEPSGGGLWVDADRAAALLRLSSPMAIVLAAPDALRHAAEWPLRIAFVDAERLGPYAALLREHGQRDAAGALCGLQRLEALRDTLAPVLLARSLDEVRARLPERVERIVTVPLPDPVRTAHAGVRAALGEALAHWQRSGWLPDAAQLRLADHLQALRRLCAGDGAPEIAAAKADALRALLDDAAAPVARLVVFGQWTAALEALADLLADLQPALWTAEQPEAQRDAELQRFREQPSCRVLLVADGAGGLDIGPGALPVVHLDQPWHPRMRLRRFGRLYRRGQVHQVPVTQLVLGDSLEQALADRADARAELATELFDAQSCDGFLEGDALQAFGRDLAQLLQHDIDTCPA